MSNVVDVADKTGTGFIQQEELMKLLKRAAVAKPALVNLMTQIDGMDLIIER